MDDRQLDVHVMENVWRLFGELIQGPCSRHTEYHKVIDRDSCTQYPLSKALGLSIIIPGVYVQTQLSSTASTLYHVFSFLVIDRHIDCHSEDGRKMHGL